MRDCPQERMTFATAIARSEMWAVAVAIMTSESGSIIDIEGEQRLVNISMPLLKEVHDMVISKNFMVCL
jgi:hypothetical protein